MKTKSLHSILFTLLIVFFVSCNTKDITTSKALDTLAVHLEEKPEYESTSIQLGAKKLRKKKDSLLINQYRTLEREGLIAFENESAKKKWLSKDSIWNTTVKLTEKAHPYVIAQKNDKITVKTIIYTLDKNNAVQLTNKSAKSATATVMLTKEYTPFMIFSKDKNPNTNFITKKYKLRFSEDKGWTIN